MIITTQVTKDYWEKCQPLIDSIKKNWGGRVVVGFMGFTPDNYVGEHFIVDLNDIPCYRENYPTNRKQFASMQHGEFIDYIKCDEDEIICCIDADTIMQRKFTRKELIFIERKLQSYNLLTCYSANPPVNLKDVLTNIGTDLTDEDIEKIWGVSFDQEKEFTTSILIAKKSFFRILKNIYNSLFTQLELTTGHHAGCQWLVSLIMANYTLFILPPTYQCASWYETFNTEVKDGELYVDNQQVIFNHTKFL